MIIQPRANLLVQWDISLWDREKSHCTEKLLTMRPREPLVVGVTPDVKSRKSPCEVRNLTVIPWEYLIVPWDSHHETMRSARGGGTPNVNSTKSKSLGAVRKLTVRPRDNLVLPWDSHRETTRAARGGGDPRCEIHHEQIFLCSEKSHCETMRKSHDTMRLSPWDHESGSWWGYPKCEFNQEQIYWCSERSHCETMRKSHGTMRLTLTTMRRSHGTTWCFVVKLSLRDVPAERRSIQTSVNNKCCINTAGEVTYSSMFVLLYFMFLGFYILIINLNFFWKC